jgi:hypothetical protein
MKKLCATTVPTNMSGNPLDLSWQTANQRWTHLPHVIFLLNKTVKLASKEPTFKQLKMSTSKMAELLKENTMKGVTGTYSNHITEISFWS